MENFQLYRTNVLLSGLMKWNLLLNLSGEDLLVLDFHLSPVSKSVPFNKYKSEHLLNYSHNDNLRKFYKNISGSFYEDYIDPVLKGPWPIICKPGDKIDSHDNTYEMGCKRACYDIYNKLFEFFCPLWLEKLEDDETLIFEINVTAYNEKYNEYKTIMSKLLELKDIKNYSFHNKFIKYFKNYCKTINLNKGNDNVLSVNLDKGSSLISGVDTKTGDLVIKDLPNLVKNLLHRERPLIEFDSMLINNFKLNHMISSQLFNFNLCFNVDDIIPKSIIEDTIGLFFMVSVKTFIKNNKNELTELPLRDFYSNYEYIKKKKCGPILDDSKWNWEFVYDLYNPEDLTNDTLIYSPIIEEQRIPLNVLSYLKDFKCLDTMNQNKMIQNIIHWSLYDNNDYILNAYDGFSGYSHDSDYDIHNMINHLHLYDDTPDIHSKKFSQTRNNLGWANWVNITNRKADGTLNSGGSKGNWDSFGYGRKDWAKKASEFSGKWINNVKYFDDKYEKGDITDLKLLLIKLTNIPEKYDPDKPYISDELEPLPNWFPDTEVDENGNQIIPKKYEIIPGHLWYTTVMSDTEVEDGHTLFIVSNKMDHLTFASLLEILTDKYNNVWKENIDIRLKSLLHKMQSVDSSNNPPIIVIKNTLITDKAKSPSLLSDEINYYKYDNSNSYVVRYSGKVKPTFVDKDKRSNYIDKEENRVIYNYLYYKDYLSDDRSNGLSKYQKSQYALYSNSGLTPLYPSINYYAIRRVAMSSNSFNYYDKVPNIFVSEYDNQPIPLINQYEYSWYNVSMCLFLKPELHFRTKIEKIDNTTLKDEIKKQLGLIYKISNEDKKDLLDYIYSLYEPNCLLEYATTFEPVTLKPGQLENIDDYIYDVKLTLK